METIKKAWWKEAVVYQIYPRSFQDSNGDGIGDINGILQRLDYLKLLGVDVIWLCPIYQSPNDDNGYDISDYQSILKEFGTQEDFECLLKAAHDRGIKIIMDLVVNHTSDEHKWFVESRKSKDNPYRDYYIWREGKDGKEPNNWGSFFSGPAWKYDEQTQMYFLHLFSPKQPDLNWQNSKVRDAVYNMMAWWLDKGIDGFRMDVISLISKNEDYPDGETNGNLYGNAFPFIANGPHVHQYLQEMNEKVLSKYDIMTVGETPGVTVEEAQKYAGTDAGELNMVFQFEHMDLDGGKYGKWSNRRFKLTDLKKTLSKWQTGLNSVAWNSLYWNNHDQPRAVSRFGNDSTPEFREKSAKMLSTCLHMMQGTPYIFQGEELGMTNVAFESLDDYRDLETFNAYHELVEQKGVSHDEMMQYIYKVGRDNARTPMQWSSSEHAGFTAGTPWIKVNPNYTEINAESQLKDPNSVFHYYKKLIQLRKLYDVIVYGNYQMLVEDSEQVFAYKRTLLNKKLLVLCNFTDHPAGFFILNSMGMPNSKLLISNYPVDDEENSFTLRPYEARVYYSESCDNC